MKWWRRSRAAFLLLCSLSPVTRALTSALTLLRPPPPPSARRPGCVSPDVVCWPLLCEPPAWRRRLRAALEAGLARRPLDAELTALAVRHCPLSCRERLRYVTRAPSVGAWVWDDQVVPGLGWEGLVILRVCVFWCSLRDCRDRCLTLFGFDCMYFDFRVPRSSVRFVYFGKQTI